MKPFVTVILPAHNEETHIAQSLSSLIDQDYGLENYEIIVIDNNSSDNTAKIVRSFEQVRYLFKEHGPVGAVRNYGAQNAKGDFLAFVDSDCVAPRNWISIGSELLLKEPDTAFGGKYEVPQDGTWIEKYWLLGSKKLKNTEGDLLGGTIFISKNLFNSVMGFNTQISSGEDTKLSKDLRQNGNKVEVNQSLNVVHLGNAKTIYVFIKRQAWHSENYIINFKESTLDPTFYLIIFFVITLIYNLLIISTAVEWSPWALIGTLTIPAIFSAKRLKRARHPRKLITKLHKLYAIDILYLTGRVIGLVRGIKLALRPERISK